MKMYFPKLTQTHVFIRTDEAGNGFLCPMLPVSRLAELNELHDALAKVSKVEEMEGVRQKMLELVKTVMPPEYHSNLPRLDIPKLTELIAYLMYGDPDDDDQPPKKPNGDAADPGKTLSQA